MAKKRRKHRDGRTGDGLLPVVDHATGMPASEVVDLLAPASEYPPETLRGDIRGACMDWKPPRQLTPRRARFAVLWAEAPPDKSLADIAREAGFSESCCQNGNVAAVCRDPAVRALRDARLVQIMRSTQVTPERALLWLDKIVADGSQKAADRVAASKTILAWYSANKGQHAPEPQRVTGSDLDRDLQHSIAEHLGIPAAALAGSGDT